MKKFISKIKNKRLKGNVTLLVIFILLASSVIALLSINQIQRLLTYGNMTFNYFRAFYLAKAGTELGLTEVYNSGNGFNHSLSGDNLIVQNNLVGTYTGFNPYFNMTITGSFKHLTDDIRESDNCSSDNKIKLNTGAGIMLSLFSDGTTDLDKILSDDKDKKYESLNKDDFGKLSLEGYNNSSKLTFAFFIYSGDEMTDIIVETGNDLGKFLKDKDIPNGQKGYLTIKNSGDQPVEFCIHMNGKDIPYSDSLITVRGNYADMEVGLQSVVEKGVPDWTLNILGRTSSS